MTLAPRKPCLLCAELVERERASREDERHYHDLLVQALVTEKEQLHRRIAELEEIIRESWRGVPPIELELFCPSCKKQHLDIGEFATRVHRKHLCENTPEGPGTGCGHLWVPFEYATKGVLEVQKPEDS